MRGQYTRSRRDGMEALCLAAGLATGLLPARAAFAGSWTVVAAPNAPQIDLTETVLADGRVLSAGGEGLTQHGIFGLRNAEVFDPTTNKWHRVANMHYGRSQPTATLLSDGTVLLAGGTHDTANAAPIAPGEIYNPKTNTWTVVGRMVMPRFDQMATLLRTGNVLICGGTPDVSTNFSSCELYLPSQQKFVLTGDMNIGRRYSALVTLPSGDVLTDGDDSGAEVYSVSKGSWAGTSSTPNPNFAPTFAVLADGSVLEPTNYYYNGNSGVSDSNFYHPKSNTWTASAPTLGRVYAATVTLTNGLVLTTGGCSFTCATQNLNTTSIYDPATNSWSDGPSMNKGREDHTAVRLNDGRVLVVGGGAPAEIYAY